MVVLKDSGVKKQEEKRSRWSLPITLYDDLRTGTLNAETINLEFAGCLEIPVKDWGVGHYNVDWGAGCYNRANSH